MKANVLSLNLSLLLLFFIMSFSSQEASAQTNNAFGNNMAIVDTVAGQPVFAIYSGDVNQDGVIDATDFNVMEADVLSFSSGYIVSDVNGDGVADASDFNLLEKNVLKFVAVVKP